MKIDKVMNGPYNEVVFRHSKSGGRHCFFTLERKWSVWFEMLQRVEVRTDKRTSDVVRLDSQAHKDMHNGLTMVSEALHLGNSAQTGHPMQGYGNNKRM